MRWHVMGVMVLTGLGALSLGAQSPPTLRLTENLRLDANTEDFSSVREIAVSARGTMALVQPQDLAIRVYDATGKRVAEVGRRGRGPGEFVDINRLGWLADSLWVWDYALRRIVWFDRTGKHLRTVATPQAVRVVGKAGVASVMDVYHASSNGALRGVVGIADPATNRPGAPVRYVAAIAADGAARIQVKPPQYEDQQYMIDVGGMMARVPFAGMPSIWGNGAGSRVLIVSSDQLAPAGGTFTITVLGTGIDTLLRRVYPANSPSIPQRSIDSALAALGRTRDVDGKLTGTNLSRAMVAEAKKRIPTVYPGATVGRIGIDGVIMVARGGPGTQRIYALFDERGTPLGDLSLPENSTLREVSRTTAWVTVPDDDGLYSVVRYSISGLPRPSR